MRFPIVAASLGAVVGFLVAFSATALADKLTNAPRAIDYLAHLLEAAGAALIFSILTFALVSRRYPTRTPTLGPARGAFLSLAGLFIFVVASLVVSGKSMYIPMLLFVSFFYFGVPVLMVGALFGVLVTRLAIRRHGT